VHSRGGSQPGIVGPNLYLINNSYILSPSVPFDIHLKSKKSKIHNNIKYKKLKLGYKRRIEDVLDELIFHPLLLLKDIH
jgi:hypothetical protein